MEGTLRYPHGLSLTWPCALSACLHQILRGLRWSSPLEIEGWQDSVVQAKWRLRHGQLHRADQALGELAADLAPRLGPVLAAIQNG
jgi:hypothetical protein